MGTGIIKCHSGNECLLVTKLRECASSTEISLVWKFEKAASGTAAVVVGTASDGGPASGRWPDGRQPSPHVTSVTSVTSSLTALVTFWLRYLPLSEPCFRGVTSVTNFFQVSSS